MELSKNFTPAEIEDKWSKHWISKQYFKSSPDHRKPFTVVIPPPNVTGVLHMGHTLNETIQDILIRNARMNGFNACWVPGTDHASIATEARVVSMLKEKGIDKNKLSRQEFLKYAFEWKEKYGDIIYHQIARLGCSVDWDRVTFTMDDHYYQAVIKIFVDLFNKGLIYRGARMINWDPAAKTALSDEEVEYKDVKGVLYHIKYELAANDTSPGNESITIATQRPETIMGDTAVCANPGDERYAYLKGRSVIIPLINKHIPVIFDEYVDKDFGTGILKITPAHDINDYNIGLKYNLPIIDTLNDNGTLNEAAKIYTGEDRFIARQKIVEELRQKGFLIKEEEYETRLGFSQRTNVVVEPKISTQWFVKMKELAKPALDAVINGDIIIHPEEKYIATYKYWLENVKDWCISRQLWWGQQIPAWYDDEGRFVVAASEEKAKEIFNAQHQVANARLRQDEDVLDTWFSSWLWPMEVFKGITEPGNKDINYYYPTSVLVTGQDIIFFWVARMIMSGMEYMKEKPFTHVYFTGMVRDNFGRKMSKSLGNSPDLLKLIEKYGADAVRFGILISSPAGNDLLFDEASLEQGRNFNNKMWNALKLIKIWEQRVDNTGLAQPVTQNFAIGWFENKLNKTKAVVEKLYTQFRLSEALKTIYSLIWDDFCSWYLEWVKPQFEQPVSAEVYNRTVSFVEEWLQLLHPFMPFITEEIYHLLKVQPADLTIKQTADKAAYDQSILDQGNFLKEAITAIRDAKNKNQVKPKEKIKLHIQTADVRIYRSIGNILTRQVNSAPIEFVKNTPVNTIMVMVNKDKFFIETEEVMNAGSQKEQMVKDLDYLKGFLKSIEKKLSNENFVKNAKEQIIELEKKKKADAEDKIKVIEESLSALN